MKSVALDHGHVFYLGPDPKEGALPAVFYFALAAEESLKLDPYNQPVKKLLEFPLRVFSLSLPEHSLELSPLQGLERWSEKIGQGLNIITDFSQKVSKIIEELVEKGWVLPQKAAVAGLSRGGFVATHIAAHSSHVHTILGFAPLTSLQEAKEFSSMKEHSLTLDLSLHHLHLQLVGKQLRFYIGNRDLRVGTERCFHFIQQLTEASFEEKHRSPPVELFIYPSIGHQGHGTPPEIFNNGAEWLAKCLI